MKWISVEDKLPPFCGSEENDTSQYVWVTDGEIIELAEYIFKPRNYGCAVSDDYQEATCGPQPHWHFLYHRSFKEGDLCFARIENNEVTHWMPLPTPPKD